MFETMKAALLSPVAGVGAFMGLMVSGGFGVPNATDLLIGGLVLGAMHLPVIGLLLWLRSRPNARFFDHSFTTWFVLCGIAYGLGLACGAAVGLSG